MRIILALLLALSFSISAHADARQLDFLMSAMQDVSGVPLAGDIVVTRNSANSAAKAVWEDKDQTEPSTTGKAQFTLDSEGRATVFGDGIYTIIIYDSADTGLTSPLYTFSGVNYGAGDGVVTSTATYSTLQGLTIHAAGDSVNVTGRTDAGDGGGGLFYWDASDLSAEVTADSESGIYVPPTSDLSGASGCWVRQWSAPIDAFWFGAKLDGSTDDTDALQGTFDTAEDLSAGNVYIPAGTAMFSQLILRGGVRIAGAGHGETTLSQIIGTDDNAILTENYGAGDIQDFGMKDLTINCNYFVSDWNADPGVLGNTDGRGLSVMGWNFDFDIELKNVPGVGAIFDYNGTAPTDQSVFSRVSIFGKDFGEEGVIFNGPNDIILDTLFIGRPGILPRPAAETTVAVSQQWPTDSVDGVVVNNANVEIGLIHVFANWSGVGFRSRGTCRVEGEHLISESNRGQVVISPETYGSLLLVSIRRLSLLHPDWTAAVPSYTQPDEEFDGVTLNSDDEFSVGTLAAKRTITGLDRVPDTVALSIIGDLNAVGQFTYNNSTAPAGDVDFGGRYTGDALYIAGDSNTVGVALHNVTGNAVFIDDGDSNYIYGTVNTVVEDATGDAAIYRVSSAPATGINNNVNLSVTGATNVLNADGAPYSEKINLTYKLTSADTLLYADDRTYGGQQWLMAGVDVTTPYNTVDIAANETEVTLVTDTATVQTIDSIVRLTHAIVGSVDVNTISGGIETQIVILRTSSNANDVVVKDGVDNINLEGDCTLSTTQDKLMIMYDGTAWNGISCSNNSI